MSCGHYPRLHRSDHLCGHTVRVSEIPRWEMGTPAELWASDEMHQFGVKASDIQTPAHEDNDD